LAAYLVDVATPSKSQNLNRRPLSPDSRLEARLLHCLLTGQHLAEWRSEHAHC
jgi:hypothetical protein